MMESQPELFNQLHQLDLWKQVYAFGIEGLDKVSECDWNFSNLDDAFKEGGVLHGNRVYLYSSSEAQLLLFNGQQKVFVIPTVVAIVSPSHPPSDKIEVSTSGTCFEEVLDMRQMNMDWVPYTPQGQWGPFERLESQIFIPKTVQRRADLKYVYCGPYFYHPLKEDEKNLLINIIYPFHPEPVVCPLVLVMEDWEVEEIIDEIATDKLSEDYRDDFKEFVWTKFRERKIAYHEERKHRLRAQENELAAIEKMRFYKFYPVPSAGAPDISQRKVPHIRRFYGKTHQVF